MVPQQRRRVSYVIPPPVESVPQLQLPPHGIARLGSIGPLLIPRGTNRASTGHGSQNHARHPRHRLGISSLALDISTQLAGRGSPEGILYSGGRDGLIMSWDLGIPMKKRKLLGSDGLQRKSGRWEIMTGWADDIIDEEVEEGEDKIQSDGDILGEVTVNKRRQKRSSISYESQWETDLLAYKPGKPSEFRQCTQAHADWINDILLCNVNQTVISASSDGTVKSWSPHFQFPMDPLTIGSHNDYVRCLTHSREHNWVASGSFDRTIKLWDLTRSEQHDPLATLNPPDTNAPKSSIYALAADPFGTMIASGSPERVVRLWDPRTGKRIGKLVGHTDNIRAILISDDSKYLLTGSADASIKLWSLSSQRCLHTFTHHTESVWSLYSSHPSLEIFYSGDRSGLVCKVDVEGCSDISEGECVLVCQDVDLSVSPSDGINKIVAMDDNLLWTGSGHSNIKRWKVHSKRSVRSPYLLPEIDGDRHLRSDSPDSGGSPSATSTRPPSPHGASQSSFHPSYKSLSSEIQHDSGRETLCGIPFESLVKLISANEPFTQHSTGRQLDAEVATLYSAASIKSVPRMNGLRSPLVSTFTQARPSPLKNSRTEGPAPLLSTARLAYEVRELATDAVPLQLEPDDIITGDRGLVRSILLNDRMHALTIDTSGEVAVWDIVRGLCLGRFLREDVEAASRARSATDGSGGDMERSPREVLEAVRERVEGEAVVSSWTTPDTKAGALTIHLTEKSFEAEMYADEIGYAHDRRFNDESKINLGKWVLQNLFLGFISEEQRARRGPGDPNELDGPTVPQQTGSSDVHTDILGRLSLDNPKRLPFISSTIIRAQTMIPSLPPTSAPSKRASPLLTPMIPIHTKDGSFPASSISTVDLETVHRRIRSATVDNSDTLGLSSGEQSLARARQPSLPGILPISEGGLMGRLRHFGKISGKQRPVSEISAPGYTTHSAEPSSISPAPNAQVTKTPVELLLAGPLTPASSTDSPPYPIPPNTMIYISEEASPSFTTVYRGTVANVKYDVQDLEDTMPLWLMECLLLNKLPPLPPHPKISFILLPWPSKNPEEQLPELLNHAQSKLNSSRYLRVLKVVIHVQEKLEKILPHTKPGSPYEGQEPRSHLRAEDVYEILCNDVVLPLGMSLASVRQYVWKQSPELTMYYRRKSHPLSSG